MIWQIEAIFIVLWAACLLGPLFKRQKDDDMK